jgi:hypothetical protein
VATGVKTRTTPRGQRCFGEWPALSYMAAPLSVLVGTRAAPPGRAGTYTWRSRFFRTAQVARQRVNREVPDGGYRPEAPAR